MRNIDKKVPNVVITIGRQFGSGGRELGRKVADLLGYAYYDKELLSHAARGAGVAEEIVRENDERGHGFLSSVLSFSMGFSPMSWYQNPTSISSDSIYESQSDVIRRLADQGPCVIVGRSADYVLRDNPRAVNVFVHADEESCIDRITSRGDVTDREQARAMLRRTNKLRARYYNFYTDKRWGDAASYHLTFDTGALSTDAIARVIASYVKERFGVDGK